MTNKEVSPDVAINAFLAAVKDAAAEIPEFKARLISALGYTVLYEGAEQFEGSDTVAMAERWSEDAFKRIWKGAKVTDIKAAMKSRGLATNEDMKSKNRSELVQLLYDRSLLEAQNDGRI